MPWLAEGSEVRLAGVRVGKIDEITLPPSEAPNAPRGRSPKTIDSTIDGRQANERIRTDSHAQQGSPSLLGNEMLINILPNRGGQPVKDYAILPLLHLTCERLCYLRHRLAQRLSKCLTRSMYRSRW